MRVDVLWNSFSRNALPSVWRTIFRAHEPDAADMFVAIEGDTPGDRRILIFDLGIGLSPQVNRVVSFARLLQDAWRGGVHIPLLDLREDEVRSIIITTAAGPIYRVREIDPGGKYR